MIKLAAILCFVTLILGCKKDIPSWFNPGGVNTDEYGYLDLSNINLRNSDEEEIILTTKADLVDATDDYIITITLEKDNTISQTITYGELKSLTEPISLMPGLYTISVKSPDNAQGAMWNAPTYSAVKTGVEIIKNQNTSISDLVCTLSNIKTTVTYSADLQALFMADDAANPEKNLVTSISLGSEGLDFTRDIVSAEDAGFYTATNDLNVLNISLSGYYNLAASDEEPNYVQITGWQQIINNVKAGQWRKIFLKVDHANEGNVTIILTVETWVLDEKIDIDVKSFPITQGEEELDDEENEITDPLSPIVVLTGKNVITNELQDINRPFSLVASMFDFDGGSCFNLIKAKATPTAGSEISSVMVEFDSDNSDFVDRVLGDGFEKGRVPLYPTNMILDYIAIKKDDNYDTNKEITAVVNNTGMVLLSNYEGTHEAKIVLVDDQNRESYTKLIINVDRTGMPIIVTTPPEILWRGGYNFDEVHDIPGNPALPVVFDITSKTGITKFVVNITGTALTAEDLIGVNLAPTIDLINPGSEATEGALSTLGFPYKDAVINKKELTLDISQFMPLLAQVAETGDTSNFELIVGDASGTTTVNIQLRVVITE